MIGHVFSSDILLSPHSTIHNTTLPNDPTSHLTKYCTSNRIILGHTFCPATQGGFTPTHAAARLGHAEAVKALIVANADVNAANKVKQMQVLALRLIAEHVEDTKALVLRPIQKKKVKLNFLYRPACVRVCVCVCIYMYYIIICIY